MFVRYAQRAVPQRPLASPTGTAPHLPMPAQAHLIRPMLLLHQHPFVRHRCGIQPPGRVQPGRPSRRHGVENRPGERADKQRGRDLTMLPRQDVTHRLEHRRFVGSCVGGPWKGRRLSRCVSSRNPDTVSECVCSGSRASEVRRDVTNSCVWKDASGENLEKLEKLDNRSSGNSRLGTALQGGARKKKKKSS